WVILIRVLLQNLPQRQHFHLRHHGVSHKKLLFRSFRSGRYTPRSGDAASAARWDGRIPFGV
ncbi:MAG: hypothetical protein IJ049_06595, partial [Oscillospiraceae bacterium]|nr:hypothetical protein [Oscillospiraceae bacterium]